MSSLQPFLLGSALLACVSLALAAEPVASPAFSRASTSTEQALRARAVVRSVEAQNVQAKELVANSYRAYPASCLSDPLPTSTSGVLFGGTVPLYAYDTTNTSNPNSIENVTITIWRVSCSSSGDKLNYNPTGGPVSATLMRIQRNAPTANANGYGDGDSDFYPTFPGVRIAQGSIAFDNLDKTDFVRVPPEPNTVISDTLIDTPIIQSQTFVLENYPAQDLGYFLFNNAFQIRFDNFYVDSNGNHTGRTAFNVGAYNPTQATYPAASQPLPINGYMTGSWYDPTHSGEGILTQVFELPTGRLLNLTWYTYDAAGIPFWLTASGTFNAGDTSVQNMTTTYVTGGGFAGGFTPPVTSNAWGKINVQFANCQNMTFTYNGSTPTVTGGPSGSGTKTFTRLGSINSLGCE
jgi:hypothetical protein